MPGTKRIVGRLIVSQRASASAASFLPRLTLAWPIAVQSNLTPSPSEPRKRPPSLMSVPDTGLPSSGDRLPRPTKLGKKADRFCSAVV